MGDMYNCTPASKSRNRILETQINFVFKSQSQRLTSTVKTTLFTRKVESRAVFCLSRVRKIHITHFFYCQRCKVDKNVSTQDEFELAPMKKVVTPKVRTVKAKKIETVQFQFFRAR